MSIAQMQKILIACYQTEAQDVLEAIQSSGMMQILDAERAIVSKEWPELHTEIERPKNVEEVDTKISSALKFLNEYAVKPTLAQALAPRTIISKKEYTSIIRTDEVMEILKKSGELAERLRKLREQTELLTGQLNTLLPWEKLDADLADLERLEKGAVILGLIPTKKFALAEEKIKDFQAEIEKIGSKHGFCACVVAALKENSADVYKALRSIEFESVNLTHFKGIPAELIKNIQKQIQDIARQIADTQKQAQQLSKDRLKLQILSDYYTNLLGRERTRLSVPETDQTVLLEGWVKKHDVKKIQESLAKFEGTSLDLIDPAEDEPVPVEIENNKAIRPFETITRLYGMPEHTNVDPTVFLAPFFAIFFGLCISDVGYGIILTIMLGLLLRKVQAGKGALTLFLICGFTTILGGIITGSWFADTFTTLIPQQSSLYSSLNGIREKLMFFDPLKSPLTFVALSLALGYIQIMFGFCIAFIHNLLKKDFTAAICDQLVWIVFLNNFIVLYLAKGKIIPVYFGTISIVTAIACALIILLFTVRQGPLTGRLGMGLFQLFSTVFYVGDILSYVRLMALGMVSGGFGMAINVIVKLLMDVPYAGYILGGIVFVCGHTMNLALSFLGAFVHSLRLQFVEFFPKFFVGGGTDFRPLRKEYKHIMIKE
ncbi:MAG: V-type ATP synthase subunit I [Sedimentisphaerales bacterium]|nr:V-type ATP synthase subunit I [Sedimentisphaerales bacterium]